MKSLYDASIGNIEELMHEFVNENMSNKQKKHIATYMKTIAINAFRIGYQSGKVELTEDDFNKLLYSVTGDHKVINSMNEILFRINL